MALVKAKILSFILNGVFCFRASKSGFPESEHPGPATFRWWPTKAAGTASSSGSRPRRRATARPSGVGSLKKSSSLEWPEPCCSSHRCTRPGRPCPTRWGWLSQGLVQPDPTKPAFPAVSSLSNLTRQERRTRSTTCRFRLSTTCHPRIPYRHGFAPSLWPLYEPVTSFHLMNLILVCCQWLPLNFT